MKINIDINDDLMAKAQLITGLQDKNTLIANALQLYVTIENKKNGRFIWKNRIE